MCNSRTLFFSSNLIILFAGLGILLYCSLAFHTYATSYGTNLEYELIHSGLEDYRYNFQDEFIRPREPTFWDSIRMFFGGEDYNNYKNNNELLKSSSKVSSSRSKRNLLSSIGYQPRYQPMRTNYYPGGGPNVMINTPLNTYSNRQYSDDTRLLDNPNFISIILAMVQVSIILILVILGLFATVSLSVSSSISNFIIRLYVWLSFFMIIITIILGVYLCTAIDKNTNYQQRHLMKMYHFYSHNDAKFFPTHFIDTLQVHLECCGTTSPVDFNYISKGGPIMTYSNWLPRSCCARNRDELMAPWVRPSSYDLNQYPSSTQCNLMNIPDDHKKGCLNLVLNMIQTWYTVMMLWCVLSVVCLLISIIVGNQIKHENNLANNTRQ